MKLKWLEHQQLTWWTMHPNVIVICYWSKLTRHCIYNHLGPLRIGCLQNILEDVIISFMTQLYYINPNLKQSIKSFSIGPPAKKFIVVHVTGQLKIWKEFKETAPVSNYFAFTRKPHVVAKRITWYWDKTLSYCDHNPLCWLLYLQWYWQILHDSRLDIIS